MRKLHSRTQGSSGASGGPFAFPKNPTTLQPEAKVGRSTDYGLELKNPPRRRLEGGELKKSDNPHVSKVTAVSGRTNVMNGTVAASRVSIVVFLVYRPVRRRVHVRVAPWGWVFLFPVYSVRSSFPSVWLLLPPLASRRRWTHPLLAFVLGRFYFAPILASGVYKSTVLRAGFFVWPGSNDKQKAPEGDHKSPRDRLPTISPSCLPPCS